MPLNQCRRAWRQMYNIYTVYNNTALLYYKELDDCDSLLTVCRLV